MVKKHLKLIVFSLLMVFIMLIGTAGPALAEPQKIRVLIGFDKNLISNHQRDSRIAMLGGRTKRDFKFIPAVSAELPPRAIAMLKSIRGISYIEEDGQVEAIEDDGQVGTLSETIPWGISRVNAPAVFPYNKGTDIKVAIIDTGIDYSHPDLAENYADGYDFYYDDDNPMDDNGHGTHVAGIVAAVADNGLGVVGVAPEAELYAIKVLSSAGYGYVSGVVEGIYWAIANNVQVINMSLGVRSHYATLKSACDAAYNAGIIVVAAAGNSGNSAGTGTNTLYPANYDSVIAVGATTSSDVKASFSSTGPAVELAAPGVDIYSTYRGGDYRYKDGTSMAAPHVAGVAALAFNCGMADLNDNGFINDEIRTRLQETALNLHDLGTPGRDTQYGFGLVDASPFTQVNEPPSAPVISVTPDPAYTDEPLQATVTTESVDPNDDDVDYSYDWYLNPDLDTVVATGAELPASFTEKDQTWTCVVTPNDGLADGDTGQDSAEIINSPPSADAGEDQYLEYAPDTVVYLNGGASSDSDPDDIPLLSYSWVQDSSDPIQVLLENANTASANFTPPATGNYTFTLTVTDVDLAEDTDNVTVHLIPPNPAPVLSSGGATPGSGVYNTDFVFSVTYQDDWGEAPTEISVSVNGTTYPMPNSGGGSYVTGVTFSTDSIPGMSLGVGTHSVEFAASDGHRPATLDEGLTVTVLNTAPPAPTNVIIAPPGPYTSENLTVSFNQGPDADGDEITHTYEWYADTVLSSTENPVPWTATGKGETWTCNVTAHDPHGGSAWALSTNSLTILNSPPVADAGPDKDADNLAEVTLEGSSYDADSDTLTYLWEQTQGPAVVLSDNKSLNPTFTPDTVGVYRFRLTVKDDDATPASDTDEVAINVITPHSLHVSSIDMSLVYRYMGWRTRAMAVVTVFDSQDNPVGGVTVRAHWTGATRDGDAGTTDSNGMVNFYSDFLRRPSGGTAFTIIIDDVSLGDWHWDTGGSVLTETIIVP